MKKIVLALVLTFSLQALAAERDLPAQRLQVYTVAAVIAGATFFGPGVKSSGVARLLQTGVLAYAPEMAMDVLTLEMQGEIELFRSNSDCIQVDLVQALKKCLMEPLAGRPLDENFEPLLQLVAGGSNKQTVIDEINTWLNISPAIGRSILIPMLDEVVTKALERSKKYKADLNGDPNMSVAKNEQKAEGWFTRKLVAGAVRLVKDKRDAELILGDKVKKLELSDNLKVTLRDAVYTRVAFVSWTAAAILLLSSVLI